MSRRGRAVDIHMDYMYDPLMKKFRLNLDFSPAVEARLKRLKATTDAASFVEVIRRALATYELLVNHTYEGIGDNDIDRILVLPSKQHSIRDNAHLGVSS